MPLYNLNNEYNVLIFILILILIYIYINKKEKFNNVQPTQNYKLIHKNIIQQQEIRKAPHCDSTEIQIGEYCKNYKSDKYTRICNENEKYSDGYCVKVCPKEDTITGNQHVCLSKCPKGYIDDGYNCIEIQFLN